MRRTVADKPNRPRKDIRVFDYLAWANELRDEIRAHAEQIAKDNELTIEFIRKMGEFRKDDRIQEILESRGARSGLVHIFSAVESCNACKPWHDKTTGKTFVKNDSGKCLHYYFYFMDPVFGLCYLRVPTWAPFRLQFYMNGHNWPASRLGRQDMACDIKDTAFVHIDDWDKAQRMSDHIRVEDLHHVLDILANRYCPAARKLGLMYRWSLMQVEYATDIVFEKPDDLKRVYDTIVHTAIHSVKPDNIVTFPGAKLHWKYEGEMGQSLQSTYSRDENQAPDGCRQHQNVRQVRLCVAHRNDGQRCVAVQASPGRPATRWESKQDNDRRCKGFHFFSHEDQQLFRILSRGEFSIHGFQNKSVRHRLPERSSASISRILKRLRVHG